MSDCTRDPVHGQFFLGTLSLKPNTGKLLFYQGWGGVTITHLSGTETQQGPAAYAEGTQTCQAGQWVFSDAPGPSAG